MECSARYQHNPQTSTGVVVVDDDVRLLELIRLELEDWGVEVHCYTMVTAALVKLAEEPMSLALVDIQIPQTDGIDCLKQIVAIGNATPVVMMSANLTKDIKKQCLELGARECIDKPQIFERLPSIIGLIPMEIPA